jgi:hypothetical protein
VKHRQTVPGARRAGHARKPVKQQRFFP